MRTFAACSLTVLLAALSSACGPAFSASDDVKHFEPAEAGQDGAEADSGAADGAPDAGPDRGDARVPDAGSEAEGSTEAGDGGGKDAADAGLDFDDSGCSPVTHDNGIGEHWIDCTPDRTYTQAEALRACQAHYGTGTCAGNSCGEQGFAVCASIPIASQSDPDFCWFFQGGTTSAGDVTKSTTPATNCVAPGPMPPEWY